MGTTLLDFCAYLIFTVFEDHAENKYKAVNMSIFVWASCFSFMKLCFLLGTTCYIWLSRGDFDCQRGDFDCHRGDFNSITYCCLNLWWLKFVNLLIILRLLSQLDLDITKKYTPWVPMVAKSCRRIHWAIEG